MEIIEDSRCRLCLNSTKETQDLFTADCKYKFIVEDFIKLEIKQRKGLPTLICDSCIEIINILLKFKATCVKTQKILESQTSVEQANLELLEEKQREELLYDVDKIKNEYEEIVDECSLQVNEHRKKSKKSKTNRVQNVKSKTKKDENPEVKLDPLQKKEKKNWRKLKYAKTYETSCYICGKIFDRYRIDFHLNSHLGLRPFVCKVEECKKAFPCPTQLNHHNKHCHSDYAPYECDICGRKFKVNARLRDHKTYHYDPKIPCTICGRLVRNPRQLTKHMLVHSEERRYKCDECSKCYKALWSLKVHRRSHCKPKEIG